VSTYQPFAAYLLEMQHSITPSFALAGSAALALVSISFGVARADETKPSQATADAIDLEVLEVNLKDAVKLN